MFAGDFAPAGWMFCEGQLISIAENDQLFQVIGTTYGGDGNETFGLPDLRGRAPIHVGPGPGGITWALGENAGAESVTLATSQIPAHGHSAGANGSPGPSNGPGGQVPAVDASGSRTTARRSTPRWQPGR